MGMAKGATTGYLLGKVGFPVAENVAGKVISKVPILRAPKVIENISRPVGAGALATGLTAGQQLASGQPVDLPGAVAEGIVMGTVARLGGKSKPGATKSAKQMLKEFTTKVEERLGMPAEKAPATPAAAAPPPEPSAVPPPAREPSAGRTPEAPLDPQAIEQEIPLLEKNLKLAEAELSTRLRTVWNLEHGKTKAAPKIIDKARAAVEEQQAHVDEQRAYQAKLQADLSAARIRSGQPIEAEYVDIPPEAPAAAPVPPPPAEIVTPDAAAEIFGRASAATAAPGDTTPPPPPAAPAPAPLPTPPKGPPSPSGAAAPIPTPAPVVEPVEPTTPTKHTPRSTRSRKAKPTQEETETARKLLEVVDLAKSHGIDLSLEEAQRLVQMPSERVLASRVDMENRALQEPDIQRRAALQPDISFYDDLYNAKEGRAPAGAAPQAPAPQHDYATTQVNLPEGARHRIGAIAENIAKSDLADEGIETFPHVTVRYGLEAENHAPVAEALAGEGPVTFTVGKLKVFPASEANGSDVLVAEVDSPDLHRLNSRLASLPGATTHPEYKPHVTIAYLKPGKGAKYAKKLANPLKGMRFTSDKVEFGDRFGGKSQIQLAAAAPPVTPAKPVVVGKSMADLANVKVTPPPPAPPATPSGLHQVMFYDKPIPGAKGEWKPYNPDTPPETLAEAQETLADLQERYPKMRLRVEEVPQAPAPKAVPEPVTASPAEEALTSAGFKERKRAGEVRRGFEPGEGSLVRTWTKVLPDGPLTVRFDPETSSWQAVRFSAKGKELPAAKGEDVASMLEFIEDVGKPSAAPPAVRPTSVQLPRGGPSGPAPVGSGGEAPPPGPAAASKKGKLPAFMQKVVDFYEPGNIIYKSYWASYDKIIDFRMKPNHTFEVLAQRVDVQGNPVPGESPRWHSTPPARGDRIVVKAESAGRTPPPARETVLKVEPETGKLVEAPATELVRGKTYVVASESPELMASPGERLTYVGESGGQAQFRTESGSLLKSGVTAGEISKSLTPEGKQGLPSVESFLKGESGQADYSRLAEVATRAAGRFARPPMARPRFPAGYWAKRGGEIIPLEDMARHDNIPGTDGLAGLLRKGDVRGRGANVEVFSLEAADPAALRVALEEASKYGKEVHVDTALTSAVYDSAELAEAGYDLSQARPSRQWRRGE
jgi:2'-5' RNA ligase